jgi:hypothetical protein
MGTDMMFYRGGWERAVPGLIRMDRALLYLRQRLRVVTAETAAQGTKTLGEGGYFRISRLRREIFSIAEMSGDRGLMELVHSKIGGLGARSPRREAVAALNDLLALLETYEPPSELLADTAFGTKEGSAADGLDDGGNTKITDKQLAAEKAVFVIMPFAPEFTDVWKGGIQRAAQAEGFTPIRVDMINRSSNITDDIVSSIEKCRLAIVDVTNNNPNVMFELGYAIAKDKKNIIISQSADFLPFDIRNIRTIVYANTWSGVEELKGRIQEFLKEASPQKHNKRARN